MSLLKSCGYFYKHGAPGALVENAGEGEGESERHGAGLETVYTSLVAPLPSALMPPAAHRTCSAK